MKWKRTLVRLFAADTLRNITGNINLQKKISSAELSLFNQNEH